MSTRPARLSEPLSDLSLQRSISHHQMSTWRYSDLRLASIIAQWLCAIDRLVIRSPSSFRRACTRYARQKIHFDTHQLPTKRMKATIITYLVSIHQSKPGRGAEISGCSFCHWKNNGYIWSGVGLVAPLARSHTSADDHSRRAKVTQQQSLLIGSWEMLIPICSIGNMIGPLCFGRNNIMLRCYCYFM